MLLVEPIVMCNAMVLMIDSFLLAGFEPTPFPLPPPHTLAYSPHAELYHRNF